MASARLLLAAALAACVATLALGEEEEEVKVTHADVGISVMLLGSVGFMMSLFYLVNQKDKDMRKYSWQVISSTISIFSAVLLFQAVQGIVEDFLLEGASETMELVVAICHMLVWISILQLALAYISGAIGRTPSSIEEVELNMKCFAVLLGHITGFATIHCFATIQQQVPRSVFATFLVAPLAWIFVYVVGLLTDLCREHVALSDDGEKDEFEEKWDEETEETEDDVIGLAVSFLVIQSLRFAIGGVLPNPEGEESEELVSRHSNGEILALVGFGVFFAIVEMLRTLYINYSFKRLTPQMRNVVAMSFAWCIFFSSDWLLSSHLFRDEHGMIKEVSLALFVTAVAFSMIFLLDKIADLESTNEHLDQAIRAVVEALGILIGFSWEQAFDTGVAEVATTVDVIPRSVTKLLLALILAVVVTPAWRIHILPTLLEFEEDEEKEKEEEEKKKELEYEVEKGHHVVVSRGLEEPLLGEGEKEERSPSKKNESLVGLTATGLKQMVMSLRQRVEELEKEAAEAATLRQRNAELEESMVGISKELNDLQKLADQLAC